MLPGCLTLFAEASLMLGFLCAFVIGLDILTGHPQKMAIMNVTWPITALYFGPLALWAYYALGGQRRERKRPKSRSGSRCLSASLTAAAAARSGM